MNRVKHFFTAVCLMVVLFSGYTLAQEAAKININTATVEELVVLPGVGDSVAKSIVEHREKNGGFKTTDDLKQVKGIGDKKFEKIKDMVTVGGSSQG